jgi:putative colanic acid biosynthesis acetyltransferase WcaF
MEKTLAIQTSLSEYNNSWYKPGSYLKQLLWYLASRVFINTYIPYPMFVKRAVLGIFGARIGKNVVVKPKVNIKYPWFLIVGNDVWIGEKVWIDNLALVTLGANVCLSQECYLLTGNHDYTKSTFDLIVKSVHIEDGAWIGAKAIVCPGVTVGSHAVLAVNSVATKDLLSFGIYKGNPATYIKKRELTH